MRLKKYFSLNFQTFKEIFHKKISFYVLYIPKWRNMNSYCQFLSLFFAAIIIVRYNLCWWWKISEVDEIQSFHKIGYMNQISSLRFVIVFQSWYFDTFVDFYKVCSLWRPIHTSTLFRMCQVSVNSVIN